MLQLWYYAPIAMPAGSLEAEELRCNIQSSAPEDWRDHRPKHVQLIGIINKQLMLHLAGVCVIYVNDARSNKHQI